MFNLITLLSLLPLIIVSASPVQKRFTNSLIVSQRTGKCLASTNAVGAPVNLVDCAQGSKWDINPGSGSVILSGTGLALDAGTSPGNFGRLKVWTSYPGLYQQTWFLTGDNRIAITGGDQCLDDDGTNLQTYQCTTGNTNQIFTVRGAPPPPSSSVSPPPSSSSSQPATSSSATPSSAPAPGGGTLPVGAVYADPPNAGRRLHPVGRNDLCLTALNGGNANGDLMAVTYCFPNSSPDSANQLFSVPAQGSQGLVKLFSKNFCIDAGSNPSNNGIVKIWQCYNGLFQQTWFYSNDGKISLSSNQCIDVKEGSQPGTQKPYNSVRDLQTYQCFAGNTNQMFQVYNP